MRLRALVVGTVSVAVAVLGIGPTPTVQAAPPGEGPVVISPARGAAVPPGSTGPLIINFVTPGNYSIEVECGAYDYYWSSDDDEYYSGRESIRIARLVSDFGGESRR